MASPNTNRKENMDSADLYNTPVTALDAIYPIFKHRFGNDKIIEPACGLGVIAEYLKSKGHIVETNDLYKYTAYEADSYRDYLNEYSEKGDWVVTNPPFNICSDFVQKGFDVAPQQLLFLRTAFLETKNRYDNIFSKGHLKGIYQFIRRVECTKGEKQEHTANSVSYAWFHFDRNFVGNPQFFWIDRE